NEADPIENRAEPSVTPCTLALIAAPSGRAGGSSFVTAKNRGGQISGRALMARLRLCLAQNSPVVAVTRPESDDCRLAQEASGARGAIRGTLLGRLIDL